MNIILNYLVLGICVIGFRGGMNTALVLPVLQIALSCFHYCKSKKWQTVLVLEIHLLISTVIGLLLEEYLYLKYVSNDAESVIVFYAVITIGVGLVLTLGTLTTLFKALQQKLGKNKDAD